MKSTQALGCVAARRVTGAALLALDSVGVEDLVDLFFFVAAALDDFVFFAQALAAIVLGIAARREIAAQPHGDGSGGDLGHPRKHDDVQGVGQRRRDRRRAQTGR